MCMLTKAEAQKKPIDHTVYDGWQSIQERQISNDGKYVAYTVNPQEGDGVLVIQSSNGSFKKEIPRGYGVAISDDNQYVFFRIRPLFKDTRDARIKKKRPDEMPKDSLGIYTIASDKLEKIARVKSFKSPEKAGGWLAYHLDKALAEASRRATPDSTTQLNMLARMADSLTRVADSLKNKITEAQAKGLAVLKPKTENKPAAPKPTEDPVEEGTELVIRNTSNGKETKFKLVNEFYFSKNGNTLLVETSKKNGDSVTKASVIWIDLASGKTDTILRGFNDAKNYAMDDAGTKLAFVAERDSVAKALRKFYKLWYYKAGMDAAALKLDRNTNGVAKGLTVSADYQNNFSKDGSKLFVGLASIRVPKDTGLVDFETARLDIWHYNDDDLQPQQLFQATQELRRSYLNVWHEDQAKLVALADEDCEMVLTGNEGNAAVALGMSDKGYRIQDQWEQTNFRKLYLVNVADGTRKFIADKVRGQAALTPDAKYVLWYDWKLKNYFAYTIATGNTANITKDIKAPLFNEEDDHPDDPPPHGFMGFDAGDQHFYVYDKYDIWKVDLSGTNKPVCITNGLGRKTNHTYRYTRTDREERFLKEGQMMLLNVFDNTTKGAGMKLHQLGATFAVDAVQTQPVSTLGVLKAKNASTIAFMKATPQQSPNMYTSSFTNLKETVELSNINPQQKEYNWLTVELHKWKMLDGKMSEGLLYKPENFDSTKKYPVIFYFYERDADTRYAYRGPAPSASTVNIPYFVSNGYIVFDPDIFYKNGEPGAGAYNSIVSAARYLSKMKWVDSTKMAIQGQSWGGYQVAHLVTRTKMFAAAGAGAPVSNMFSAYGGIRWGGGISRQFQYERSQSRIGFTPWQRPDLYTKNSPLFFADKVSTPLLLMHNDKDGAVPWYQSIEYFTALRRLGKKVWLLQYNDEDHNLVERRNRKDLSIRLGQFFDHYLKGKPAAKWMVDGVPATSKGIDWGLDIKK
jgi:dipeptidyl aminopeptidase/acylaminoacyl peptidase